MQMRDSIEAAMNRRSWWFELMVCWFLPIVSPDGVVHLNGRGG